MDLNSFLEDSCTSNAEEVTTTMASDIVSMKEDQVSQHAGSPMDKLDDASTTDSGSALDAEESSSVECTSSISPNDTDTQVIAFYLSQSMNS